METNDAVRLLAALAQETRLSVFRLLVQAGAAGLTAGALAERLSVANPTLSFHFKELTHAGLIRSRQEGRYIHYSANYAAMNDLLQFLTENCCQGVPCLPEASCCEPEKEPR
ncbi:MAG: helix-turn-helix transcriptional regulator [Sterolibacteriaceae bacterium]|nr:helix-turn-helix transcriptional regulator [Candidatus Methylophosphatis haderslevensis]